MAKLCFYETSYVVTLRLNFNGDTLHYEAEINVGFGSTKEPPLTGIAE